VGSTAEPFRPTATARLHIKGVRPPLGRPNRGLTPYPRRKGVDREPRVGSTGVVPEYDAFGREIDEDPLAALRKATVDPVPAPAAAPVTEAEAEAASVSEPEPAFEPPVPPPQQFVRPPRRHRGLAALLVVGAVVAAVGWGASVVVVKVQDGLNGLDGVIGDVAPEAVAPTGLQDRSLILRANFAGALATLRESGLGRPFSLRVAPDRIDATLIGDGGRMHQVQVNADGELRELGSTTGPARQTIAFNKIDPAAPERLVRGGAERAGVRARRIDYLVLIAVKPPSWGAYFKGGKIVMGDARGRPQRVL
jgi:hypothetical protein